MFYVFKPIKFSFWTPKPDIIEGTPSPKHLPVLNNFPELDAEEGSRAKEGATLSQEYSGFTLGLEGVISMLNCSKLSIREMRN